MRRWPLLVGAEAAASLLGFVGVARLAAKLGATGFGPLEFGLALTAWWLILVRGGFDAVVTREAARYPERTARLEAVLVLGRLFLALVAWGAVVLVGLAARRFEVAALCGLSLFVSALVPDLSARATGDVFRLAFGSLSRGVVLAALSFAPVSATTAPLVFVAAEIGVWATFTANRPRGLRVSKAQVRGIVGMTVRRIGRSLPATSSRLARVTHYAADLVALGLLRAPELGDYAAARRLLFAALGMTIVIPAAALGPLAAARRRGETCRTVVLLGTRLALVVFPALLVLLILAGLGLDRLFGPTFRDAGWWLAILSIRLPLLAASALGQTVLTAAGHDAALARHAWGTLGLSISAASTAYATIGTAGFVWSFIVADAVGLAVLIEMARRASIEAEPVVVSDRPARRTAA